MPIAQQCKINQDDDDDDDVERKKKMANTIQIENGSSVSLCYNVFYVDSPQYISHYSIDMRQCLLRNPPSIRVMVYFYDEFIFPSCHCMNWKWGSIHWL